MWVSCAYARAVRRLALQQLKIRGSGSAGHRAGHGVRAGQTFDHAIAGRFHVTSFQPITAQELRAGLARIIGSVDHACIDAGIPVAIAGIAIAIAGIAIAGIPVAIAGLGTASGAAFDTRIRGRAAIRVIGDAIERRVRAQLRGQLAAKQEPNQREQAPAILPGVGRRHPTMIAAGVVTVVEKN
jgi:hypothetical protein